MEITQTSLARAKSDELKKMAASLSIDITDDDKNADIKKKIAAVLGFPAGGGELEKQDTQSMFKKVPKLAPAFPDDPEREAQKDAEDLKPITIIIASEPGEQQPVPVNVNGNQWVIQRDVEATIPMYIFRALMDAKEGVVDPKTKQIFYRPSYPVRVIS